MPENNQKKTAIKYFIPENYKGFISYFGISPRLYLQVIPICLTGVFLIFRFTPLSLEWKVGLSVFLVVTVLLWSIILLWKYDMSIFDFFNSFILFMQSTKLYRMRKPSETNYDRKD